MIPRTGLIQQHFVEVTLIEADGKKFVIIQQLGDGICRPPPGFPDAPPLLVRDVGILRKTGRSFWMERLEMVGHPGFEEDRDRVLFPAVRLRLGTGAPVRPDGDRDADHGRQRGRGYGEECDKGLVLFRRLAWNPGQERGEFADQQPAADCREQQDDSDEQRRGGNQEQGFQNGVEQRIAPGGLPVAEPLAGKAVTKSFTYHRISPPSQQTYHGRSCRANMVHAPEPAVERLRWGKIPGRQAREITVTCLCPLPGTGPLPPYAPYGLKR